MLPQQIESASFAIIEAELASLGKPEGYLSTAERAVLVRVIHASADFEFADNLVFHPHAIQSGVAALRRGATILTDVHMVRVGISARYTGALGCASLCEIDHPDVAQAAQLAHTTRSAIAMRRNAQSMRDGIVAIGNAPTALLEVVRLVREEGVRPALVVGVPVGFVNAAESKAALVQLDVPYIAVLGRKGGSTIAVAIMNALLHLALDEG